MFEDRDFIYFIIFYHPTTLNSKISFTFYTKKHSLEIDCSKARSEIVVKILDPSWRWQVIIPSQHSAFTSYCDVGVIMAWSMAAPWNNVAQMHPCIAVARNMFEMVNELCTIGVANVYLVVSTVMSIPDIYVSGHRGGEESREDCDVECDVHFMPIACVRAEMVN